MPAQGFFAPQMAGDAGFEGTPGAPGIAVAARRKKKAAQAPDYDFERLGKRDDQLIGDGMIRHSLAHKGIEAALLAKGRHGAVTGNESHLVAQRKELFTDRADQRVVIALGKVGAADGALE